MSKGPILNLGLVRIKCVSGCSVGSLPMSLVTEANGRFTATGEGVAASTVHMVQSLNDATQANFGDEDGPTNLGHSTFTAEGSGTCVSFSIGQKENGLGLEAKVLETRGVILESEFSFARSLQRRR